MRADWIECGLTDNGTSATILMELDGTPDEIERIRQMARRADHWDGLISGIGQDDRIVLKMTPKDRH